MNELLAQPFGSQPSYAGQLLGEDEAPLHQTLAQPSRVLKVGCGSFFFPNGFVSVMFFHTHSDQAIAVDSQCIDQVGIFL